jgi:hypothetical protein
VLGEYNPVEYIAQISPTPLLLPARNDALAPGKNSAAGEQTQPSVRNPDNQTKRKVAERITRGERRGHDRRAEHPNQAQ